MVLRPLTIRLFGPLRVTVCGEPLPRVRARSDEWLLALLALRHGRAVSRSWLAGTLWPESGESRSLQNLRNALVSLRKALGPEGERLQSPAPDLLTLDLAGAEVDVVRFDVGIQAGDEPSLRDAVEVYTGPLLEGCVEEWALTEREIRAEQCLEALEALAERLEGRGDHAAAIRYLRRAEALDPLRDSIARRLMVNLAASGDPAAAIQVYRDLRNRLQAELITGPDEATTRLFYEIRAAGRARARDAGARGCGDTGTEGALLPASPRLRVSASGLPRPLTPLVGREREVEAVRERLRQSRLVTLIGGGGVGKTRLALEVGVRAEAEFAGGAVWVELASLADGALVLPSVAAALGLRETEAGDTEPLESRLVARLSDGAPLLALDNCEHVLDAAAEVVQALLQHCPELHVLATSRQRLGLPGEVAWRVPSLPVPEPGEWAMVMEFAAVRLFVERAADAREGFQLASRDEADAVCLICRRLDGIPLAIELAAARVRVLTPRQIAARLDDRFRLLTTGARGALPRHQTLRALIDWSYDQLPEAEAWLLRQLAVFAGGWTLEAAESVGAFSAGCRRQLDPTAPSRHPTPYTLHPDTVLDLLDSLVDRSLVLAEEVGEARFGGEADSGGGRAPGDGDLRYRMLETVREYALEKLREHGEEEVARAAHLACFLCLAEAVGPDLRGPDPGAALTQLEAERDNLRAALRFSAEHEAFRISASPLSAEGEPLTAGEAGLRLGAALWPFWETRGYLSEGRHHLRAALKRSSLPDSAERAQALLGAARLAQHQFDLDEAETFGQESLERFRCLGDIRGMAAALLGLGEVAIERGELTTAGSRLSEGLEASRQSGWTRGSAYMLVRLGGVAGILGENARARASVEEGRALAEALGDAPTLALAFHQLANQAEGEGDDARVGPLLEQSLEISRRLGHKRVAAVTLISLGHLAERQGDRSRAISFLERAMATYREIGSRMHLLWTLLDLGSVHYRGGVYASARAMYEESLGMSRELHHPYWIAAASNNLGMACFHLGDPVRAQALHREALALYQSCGSAEGIVWALERLGVVTAMHGDPQQAARLLGAASAARAEFGNESTAWEASDLKEAAAAVREKLGPEAWETAWQAGRAMAREEAIAFALDDAET